MAIIKNGKIHGKIGNYIYRVLNGVEIIQSYPRRIKVSDNTKAENLRFSLCARMTSQIYQIIKDFALNVVHKRLYNNLTSVFRINLFSSESISRSADYQDWKLIPGTDVISIATKHSYERVLPRISIADDRVDVSLNDFIMPAYTSRYQPTAEYIELRFLLVYYDFDSKLARPVYEYGWDRELIGASILTRELAIDFEDLVQPLSHGLLIPCFGIRFFAYQESSSYLNSAVFNPFWILGIWYKSMSQI